MNKKQILFIVGPTGVGKSAVAIALAKKIDGEIISADSMQLYRGMNIGTAKVLPEEQQGIAHHLLDIAPIDTSMDVAHYRKEAMKAIDAILAKNKTPIVVGGSGLYVRSLTDGLFEGPACNPELRQKWNQLADEKGNEVLMHALKKVDPKAAQTIDLNNRRRLIRALEVYEAEKKPLSELKTEWQKGNQEMQGTPFRLFGLTLNREALYSRLNHRVDRMFENGLVEEIQSLLQQGLQKNQVALQAIGYKEVVAHLDGKISLAQCRDEVKKATRHFAKRQWTWFNRDPRVEWVELSPHDSIEKIAQILYTKIEKGVASN